MVTICQGVVVCDERSGTSQEQPTSEALPLYKSIADKDLRDQRSMLVLFPTIDL